MIMVNLKEGDPTRLGEFKKITVELTSLSDDVKTKLLNQIEGIIKAKYSSAEIEEMDINIEADGWIAEKK